MQKGKIHGTIDIVTAVITTERQDDPEARRMDVDTEEFLYHIKVIGRIHVLIDLCFMSLDPILHWSLNCFKPKQFLFIWCGLKSYMFQIDVVMSTPFSFKRNSQSVIHFQSDLAYKNKYCGVQYLFIR